MDRRQTQQQKQEEKEKYRDQAEKLCEEYSKVKGDVIQIEEGQTVDEKEYLYHLINTEKNIMILKDRLPQLLEETQKADNTYFDIRKEERSSIERRVSEELPIEEGAFDLAQYDLVAPSEPRKPVFVMREPAKPDYFTPGLFNRLKIKAINDHKKREYEEEVERYQLLRKKHEEDMEEYGEAMDLYREKKSDYDEKAADLESKLTQERVEHNKKIYKMRDEKMNELLNNSTRIAQAGTVKSMCHAELKATKSKLQELYKCKNTLLNFELVYPKYLSMVPLTTMLEYFVTGRCLSLSGPDGAYNLYESEMRANIVIAQLDKIIDSLESIKEHQYLTYTVLRDVQNTVEELNDKMTLATVSMISSAVSLSEIRATTEAIAYTSAVSAYYSKMNAELTNAMGYLVAFK